MSTASDSLLGKQLDEYRIDKALGTGGMARVYRALDVKLQRYVALKVIAPDFRTDPDYAARFEREAQSIARLEHPNVVHIHRFGEVNGLYYMAMQYIEGADLSWLIEDYRASGEVMPFDDIARVVQDISGALDYVHGKGVIHRDIKPNNIMVDSTGRAVLTDFGLALLSDLGTHGEVFGSPHYLAPEQALSSGNVVPQSDLYSLGVTLFEMLTGELPFVGEGPMNIAMQHVATPPPRPSQLNPAVPPAIDDVVMRTLEKEPYDRYQTGAELNAAFQKAVSVGQSPHLPAAPKARRPSLIMLPQKIDRALEASPLPGFPSAPLTTLPPDMPTQPSLLPESLNQPPFKAASGATTQMAIPAPQNVNIPATPTTPAGSSTHWRNALLLAVALFALGVIGIILFLAAARRQAISSAVILPTTPVPASAIPTSVPPTLTILPTEPPTPTPVTLLSQPDNFAPLPTAIIPVSPTIVTVAPSQVAAPPSDRSIIPPGSRRLGEFTVEAYCNIRGYGVVLTNNQSDWACTNPSNGSVVLTLGPTDFDNICQTRYNDATAFAIRDQQKPVQAYNWSCYDYGMPPPDGVATPSVTTLFPVFNKDWVALVNVSKASLSIENLVFVREDGSTLHGTDWGRSVLLPGECLRLSPQDKPPNEQPPKCINAIDYPSLSAGQRERWLAEKVTITISPSASFCYPIEKCSG